MPTKLTHDGIEFADGTKLQSDPIANFSDSRNWTMLRLTVWFWYGWHVQSER